MFNSPAKEEKTVNLKDGACDMSDNLQKAAYNAGNKVRGMYDSASNDLSHARDYVSTEIRTNPVRSGLIALGVGAIIGALLRK